MKKSNELTKAEEDVMQHLWELDKAFVKEIVAQFPEPQPAYNTISTIVRILENKGFVGHEAFGKSHRYYPLISKEAYAEQASKKLLEGYFGGSVEKMLSFFVKKENIDLDELDQLLETVKKKKP